MDMSKCLDRFLDAQRTVYPIALEEICRGKKDSHWMWFIFPQLRGLGRSTESWYFGIADLQEAKDYLAHPVLGQRIREITEAALELEETDPLKIFGWPDHMKFRSCMTLFARAGEDDLFARALEKYFDGREDRLTLKLLAGEAG